MKNIFKSIFINSTFFYALLCVIVAYCFSFFFPSLLVVTHLLLASVLLVLALEIYLLFSVKDGIVAARHCEEKFSNGDSNPITLTLKNNYTFQINATIVDEIPIQFQERNFEIKAHLLQQSTQEFTYSLRPIRRGVYEFGAINVFVSLLLHFVTRKYPIAASQAVKSYPSFLQLKKYELFSPAKISRYIGIRKIRKIGHSTEFEQINEYNVGDDVRKINWKATAKKNNLMVNFYQDEKSKQIYSVIDKGRLMQMPFNELALLDYSINSSLAISNIALKNHEKVGMLCFSNTIDNFVAAEKKSTQLREIIENLYAINTNYLESDFGNLYAYAKRKIPQRSLLIIYTNFETLDGMNRQLKYLKALSRLHLLLVIQFENTELIQFATEKPLTAKGIFEQTIAEKFLLDKKTIAKQLTTYGIKNILTTPENLTLDAINSYFEIKAKGLI